MPSKMGVRVSKSWAVHSFSNLCLSHIGWQRRAERGLILDSITYQLCGRGQPLFVCVCVCEFCIFQQYFSLYPQLFLLSSLPQLHFFLHLLPLLHNPLNTISAAHTRREQGHSLEREQSSMAAQMKKTDPSPTQQPSPKAPQSGKELMCLSSTLTGKLTGSVLCRFVQATTVQVP